MQKFALGAAFVVVLALIGGLLGSALGFWSRGPDASQEVSADAAASAEAKFETLRDGTEVTLTSAELTSLFEYRPETWSIRPVHSPVVEMSGDTVRLEGRIPTTEIPAEIDIGPLRSLLPDTTRVEIAGTVRSTDGRSITLDIGRVEVEGMPVPERYYHFFQLLSADTLRLPLPAGVSAVRIENGELILTP